jgi:hypothetical protein
MRISPEARACFRVAYRLILLLEHRLDAGSLENSPAPFVGLISITVIAKKR